MAAGAGAPQVSPPPRPGARPRSQLGAPQLCRPRPGFTRRGLTYHPRPGPPRGPRTRDGGRSLPRPLDPPAARTFSSWRTLQAAGRRGPRPPPRGVERSNLPQGPAVLLQAAAPRAVRSPRNFKPSPKAEQLRDWRPEPSLLTKPRPRRPGALSWVSRAGRGKRSLSDRRWGSCLRVRRVSAEPGGTSLPRRPAPSRRQSVRPTPSPRCLDSKLWPPPGGRRKGARTAASGKGRNRLGGKARRFNSFPSRGQMASPELIFGGSLPHVREAAPSMARGGTLHP